MTQVPLFVVLHLFGVAIAMAIGRRDSLLACALGFPIGLASAVLSLLLALSLGMPYRVDAAIVLIAILMGGAVFVVARRGSFARSDRTVVVPWTALFIVAALALSSVNLSRMSYDSHRLVFMGHLLGERLGLPDMLPDLRAWGSFQIVAHSLRRFTLADYLYSLQPMLGLSFIPVFVLLLRDAAQVLEVAPRRAVVILVSVALFTVPSFHHHFFYIHTNLASAIYLFIFVAVLWRAEATGDPSGLGIGFVALLAFSFQRVEGPLFAMLALTIAVLPSDLPRRTLTPWLAGFTVAVTAWHLYLAGHVPSSGNLLTSDLCLLMAVLSVALFLVWLALARPRVARLRHAIPPLAAALLTLALAAAFVLKPDHMIASAQAWARNLVELPVWKQTWFAVILLVLAGLLLERPRAGRAIVYLVPLSFMLTLLLAFGRDPYRFGIGDSANRMTNHFLPILFFYIGLKLLVAVRNLAISEQTPVAPPSSAS